MLLVDNLTISFGGLTAVSNFSLKIGEKEVVGLIGPNGAGKTTLFNMLTGVYKPDEGTINYFGEDIKGLKPYVITSKRIARTFQNIRLFSSMSVKDNLKISCDYRIKYGYFDAIFKTPKYRREEAKIDNEVNEKYANAIINEVSGSIKKEASIDSLLGCVYQKIILKLGEPVYMTKGDKPKVIMFIGPTGVGKTTTIAKLASYYKLEKQYKVAFITADTYRIAAVEQLNTYASIIECPVNVVYSVDEIAQSLEDFKDFDLIFVDTAGRSHKDKEQMLELHELRDMVAGLSDTFDLECYLTLSATTKYKDMLDITGMYADIPDYRLIFTKLDETCAYGNILNIRMATGAQLSYTTTGQNVPNDIEVINEQAIARQLLGG